jgi:tripartite-type tricarboxylate transporter receptor subunit TctC
VANVFTVHPSVSAKTVPEFIAYAKANPGKINMATNGNGSASHMSAELFKMMTGVNMVNVPYRGTAPAITALLGGQVQGSFVSLPGSIAYIKAGKLRAIAVTTAMRSEALPDIPTVAEFVPGYEASVWYGIGTPTKTPGEIIDKLNTEINSGLADPKMKERFAGIGFIGRTDLSTIYVVLSCVVGLFFVSSGGFSPETGASFLICTAGWHSDFVGQK